MVDGSNRACGGKPSPTFDGLHDLHHQPVLAPVVHVLRRLQVLPERPQLRCVPKHGTSAWTGARRSSAQGRRLSSSPAPTPPS